MSLLNNYGGGALLDPNPTVVRYWLPRLKSALAKHNPRHAARSAAISAAFAASWDAAVERAKRSGDKAGLGGLVLALVAVAAATTATQPQGR